MTKAPAWPHLPYHPNMAQISAPQDLNKKDSMAVQAESDIQLGKNGKKGSKKESKTDPKQRVNEQARRRQAHKQSKGGKMTEQELLKRADDDEFADIDEHYTWSRE